MSGVTRVQLDSAQLQRLYELAGIPVPPTGAGETATTGQHWTERLDACTDEAPQPSVVDDALAELGLMVDGQLSSGAAEAMSVWHGAAEAVEVEVLARQGGRMTRVTSRQRLGGDTVVAASSADGCTTEWAVLPAQRWWMELTRAALVPAQQSVPAEVAALPDVIEVGWECLLAAGWSVEVGQPHLIDELARDGAESVLGGPSAAALDVVGALVAARWLFLLASASVGRLHARRVLRRGEDVAYGDVEWVLLPDGWRCVEPAVRDGWRAVRLTRCRPTDLAGHLALLTPAGAR